MNNIKNDELLKVIQPLIDIANAYFDNELDDDARRFWGINYEHENCKPPKDIILYSGRGGKTLLTLQDAINAKNIALFKK